WQLWFVITVFSPSTCLSYTAIRFYQKNVYDINAFNQACGVGVKESETILGTRSRSWQPVPVDDGLKEPVVYEGYICKRCQLIQHLKIRVAELEEELTDLRCHRELADLAQVSFREIVCTPKVAREEIPDQTGRNRWVTVTRRKVKGAHCPGASTPELEVSNHYHVLVELNGVSDNSEVVGRDEEPQWATSKQVPKKREVVIVGDSIIRGFDAQVWSRERESRTVCCLPGAQVGDLPGKMDRLLARAGVDSVFIVHVGTNDIHKGRLSVLKSIFKELGAKLRSRTDKVVFSEVLPVPRASPGKIEEIRRLNAWLKFWCRVEGYRFMGHWDSFWNRWDLFRCDGLHLNWRGTNVLGLGVCVG
uniref:SGNH hydrolase-type esterase domain-containing protein n=1 Tax=Erpetoichthys calabaricus TaxID=27687 RepID=A0A8C4T207_ERPCA